MIYEAEILADLLVAHGVGRVFVSPGTRNAPIVEAMGRRAGLRLMATSPDERVAAFAALGYAAVSGEPVALVCTSGSAPLDYAPALAEAYYRHVPLIVVTADRPTAWIDQDDSQTMRQPGALDAVVKRSYDIGPCSLTRRDDAWRADREINDALIVAMAAPQGPVHINMHIDRPDADEAIPYQRPSERIVVERARQDMEVSRSRELASLLAPPRRVLVVCGYSSPDSRLVRALGRLSELPNVVVAAEPMANVRGRRVVGNPDAALACCNAEALADLRPDVVITTGGSLVSQRIKNFLRRAEGTEHWRVGEASTTVDCFGRLTRRIEMDAGYFMQGLAAAMQLYAGAASEDVDTYADRWAVASRRGMSVVESIAARSPHTALQAVKTILDRMPGRTNLQLGNGTTVRYACELGGGNFHRCDSNRGISGIDGSTSTAVGAAMAYSGGITLLLTGDMSALYDIGALAVSPLPPTLRIVVLDNAGGGIFRSIRSTRDLPVTSVYISQDGLRLPLPQLCDGFGLDYFECDSSDAIRAAWDSFVAADRAALMRVRLDADADAQAYMRLFDSFEIKPIQRR